MTPIAPNIVEFTADDIGRKRFSNWNKMTLKMLAAAAITRAAIKPHLMHHPCTSALVVSR
jgi:hypothetical protein